MRSSNIISKRNEGFSSIITHEGINLLGEWKVRLTHIRRNF